MKFPTFLVTILVLVSCTYSNTGTNDSYSLEPNTAAYVKPLLDRTTDYNEADSIKDSRIYKYRIALLDEPRSKESFTHIKYKSTYQLLQNLQRQARKEQWPTTTLNDRIYNLKQQSKGGQLELIIIRTTRESADLSQFKIVIKDSTNNQEVFSKILTQGAPSLSKINNKWWNAETIKIDKKISAPFYVYVVDGMSKQPHRFLITGLEK